MFVSRSALWIGAVALAIVIAAPIAAQPKSPGAVVQSIKINGVGDAECRMQLRLPADAYTRMKVVGSPGTELEFAL